jgi:hypothetical protein
MKRLTSKRLRRFTLVAISALSLNACLGFGSFAGVDFTLEGELPANFSLKAQAHYYAANGCDSRNQIKSFVTGFQHDPQAYQLTIPTNYRSGFCEMHLGRVGLFIYGRYGDKDWQKTYDNGGLVIVDQLPEGAPAFQPDGSLTKQAECTWWFQQSTAISRLGEISKLLNCKGAGAYLVRDELPGKTVRLNFSVNPEEKPSRSDTWIKFPEGWKPCLPKPGGWQRCQKPPLFQTFKMNGQECTVYPHCTE